VRAERIYLEILDRNPTKDRRRRYPALRRLSGPINLACHVGYCAPNRPDIKLPDCRGLRANLAPLPGMG
jgi:hypothetical protein